MGAQWDPVAHTHRLAQVKLVYVTAYLENVALCMQVLHANLASLSGTKTLPYLVMFLTSNLGGWAGDYLISQRLTSTAGGRKTINTIGTLLY